jgi:integrase
MAEAPLVFKLATLAGLRPEEIFRLRRDRVLDQVVSIQQRIYRGHVDSPKTEGSERIVALASIVRADLEAWLASTPTATRDGWLFPSERLVTAISKDNLLDRYLSPALDSVGLAWVNFQVMRRTFSDLMHNEVGADPKDVADLMGHDVNVNLNVYTQSSMARQLEAVERLSYAIVS